MSALSLGTIPSGINTYERLAMWVCQCLQSTANGVEVNAVPGAESVPLAQVQIAKTADNVDRAILVVYLPVDYEALNSSTQKTWMAAEDISLAAPHTNLLSN
jgi:hypothetical protein